ncbi:Alpha/beta hydrolase fold-1 [Pelagophyceae sp. CCMP2097]|nr:Alpha/beta hydrolase fold-1 [Pelagophyceae sp. CCMP2097]
MLATQWTKQGVAFARGSLCGNSDVTLLFAHGTGFCKEIFNPTIKRLGQGASAFAALDLPYHGESWRGRGDAGDWATNGPHAILDVVDALGADGGRRIVGVGHSMGAASLAMAELERPGTFCGLILAEPVVFPWWAMFAAHVLPSRLANATMKRRDGWADVAEARLAVKKRLGAKWTDEAVEAYVAGAMVRQDDGEGLRLRCLPLDEAPHYLNPGRWSTLSKLGCIRCPVLVTAGDLSDFPLRLRSTAYYKNIARGMPTATFHTVPGATHNIPMDDPVRFARDVDDFLAERVRPEANLPGR